MSLNLQSHIEKELKGIIEESISSGSLNPELLRMIVISPDSAYERLGIYILDEWEDYLYKDEAPSIGEINISKWLDVADEALEKQHDLEKSNIERAKEIDRKYLLTPPAISFKHLETLVEAYLAYLVCLREELLAQIEAAISNIATSSSNGDFKQSVGFFTHKLTYDLDDDMLLHAFNHPEGGKGDFYKVELRLPKFKRSDHYLGILESGFRLFCVEGTLLTKNSDASEIYTYDIADVAFVCFEDEKIHFRLNDEFQNWTLEPGINKVGKGDKSDEEFLHAFTEFINKHPDKVLNLKYVPNPLTETEDFKNWFDRVLEYNLEVGYEHLETIYNYGDEAYTYYLQAISHIAIRHESAILFLARKLFYTEQFQESLNLYQGAVKLSKAEKTE